MLEKTAGPTDLNHVPSPTRALRRILPGSTDLAPFRNSLSRGYAQGPHTLDKKNGGADGI